MKYHLNVFWRVLLRAQHSALASCWCFNLYKLSPPAHRLPGAGNWPGFWVLLWQNRIAQIHQQSSRSHQLPSETGDAVWERKTGKAQHKLLRMNWLQSQGVKSDCPYFVWQFCVQFAQTISGGGFLRLVTSPIIAGSWKRNWILNVSTSGFVFAISAWLGLLCATLQLLFESAVH